MLVHLERSTFPPFFLFLPPEIPARFVLWSIVAGHESSLKCGAEVEKRSRRGEKRGVAIARVRDNSSFTQTRVFRVVAGASIKGTPSASGSTQRVMM